MTSGDQKSRREGLEKTLGEVSSIRNQNVRNVAIAANYLKEKISLNPEYKLKGNYSEAYQGESA